MKTVHWLGAGLSSAAGIQKLAEQGVSLVVWNRTLEKAQEILKNIPACKAKAMPFEMQKFSSSVEAGDVVVSMLPAPMHTEIAQVCLFAKAHLVTTSYISPAMRAFDADVREQKLSFVNECGLDPGIDHIFAHQLMMELTETVGDLANVNFSFRSFCGGFPKEPNDFKYKFSWSPLGVLRALKNPACFIEDYKVKTANRPWEALRLFDVRGETFEAYPNRDSLAYVSEYGFEDTSAVKDFQRGTLRPRGWAKTWAVLGIFEKIESENLKVVEDLSQELWTKYQYEKGEPDRVVLFVELEVQRAGQVVFRKAMGLDEVGNAHGTAMARTVSIPAALAVEMILDERALYGVTGAPTSEHECKTWLSKLKLNGINWFYL